MGKKTNHWKARCVFENSIQYFDFNLDTFRQNAEFTFHFQMPEWIIQTMIIKKRT